MINLNQYREETMKKAVSILMVCAVALTAVACKKNLFKELKYANTSEGEFFQANLQKKDGENVLWFQVFDQKDDKGIIESYGGAAAKFEGYPAKINDNKWIWILVKDRIEIRLIADDKAKDYASTDVLKDFIKKFNLAGMAKVEGEKLTGKELGKFIPTLGEK
jgi:hypothetical protein